MMLRPDDANTLGHFAVYKFASVPLRIRLAIYSGVPICESKHDNIWSVNIRRIFCRFL